MTSKKLILYADDDVDDRNWLAEACTTVNTSIDIKFVRNGKVLIDFLKEEVTPLPALIVLDLNMPEMDGRQTLQSLKSDLKLKEIPVAIVTTSANRIDKDVCTRLGASAYLIKPSTHAGWQSIIRQLEALMI